jgi:hypothetical protein
MLGETYSQEALVLIRAGPAPRTASETVRSRASLERSQIRRPLTALCERSRDFDIEILGYRALASVRFPSLRGGPSVPGSSLFPKGVGGLAESKWPRTSAQ